MNKTVLNAARPFRPYLLQRSFLFVATFAITALAHSVSAQPQQAAGPQPLNAAISDFGVSFAFSPPICAGCVESELGFLSLEDGGYAPAVLTIAPPWLHGDASVLVNAVDSQAPGTRRITHFGNRFDFALRTKVLDHNGLVLTFAPWGAAFIRGIQGGRAGAVLLPQYTRGNNQFIAQFFLTGAVGVSSGNPRTDYIEAFDYTHAVGQRGYALFAGFQHELTAGEQTLGIEQGMIVPFRNGQVELAAQQLTLNTHPAMQFQARVIVNWGRVLARRR